MRFLSVALVLGFTVDAMAQATPPPPSAQPSPVVEIAPPPPPPMMQPATAMSVSAGLPPLSERTVSRWRRARTLQVFGGAIGLIGTGLSLSSTIYVMATGYPPNANDFLHPAKPTDTGPVLAYAGSSASALGFALSAGGLGWQHRILGELGADPGRGVYVGGTVIGLLGVVAIAASYFIVFTDYLNPHDQSITVLATSLSGAALCSTGSIMYAVDSSRMKKVWKRLTTF